MTFIIYSIKYITQKWNITWLKLKLEKSTVWLKRTNIRKRRGQKERIHTVMTWKYERSWIDRWNRRRQEKEAAYDGEVD